jgi:hypothetical protein
MSGVSEMTYYRRRQEFGELQIEQVNGKPPFCV